MAFRAWVGEDKRTVPGTRVPQQKGGGGCLAAVLPRPATARPAAAWECTLVRTPLPFHQLVHQLRPHTTPTGRGAILLTPDCTKCLLVRGYKRDAGWGFPRGKLSKDETDAQCAQREVRVGGWGWGMGVGWAGVLEGQLG